MAYRKSTSPRARKAAATRRANKAAALATAAPEPTEEDDSLALRKMLDALPALTEAQRAAFTGCYSDADCDKFGSETRSKDVLREGTRAATPVAAILAAHGAKIRYGASRLRFLVECLADLRAKRQAQLIDARASGKVRGSRAAAQSDVIDARNDLLGVLVLLSGKAPDARRDLEAARGTSETSESAAESLRGLLKLCNAWLARTDDVSRALVEGHNLTPSDAEHARQVLATYDRAHASTLPTGSSLRDSPETNRVEGRVLYELDNLRYALAMAHERNNLVPQLILGPTLRRALRGQSRPTQTPDTPTPAPTP